ncbi:MAG TPA: hypothetical protein VD997_00750 [Phycisphaerales bacterium]|nr:hypothetical protein [Phycisphaerales bacterium]
MVGSAPNRDVFSSKVTKTGRKHPLMGAEYRFNLHTVGRTEDHVGSQTICKLLLQQFAQDRRIQVLSPVIPVRGDTIEVLVASERPIDEIEFEVGRFCSMASELTTMDTTSDFHYFMNNAITMCKTDRKSTVLGWIEMAQRSMVAFLDVQLQAQIFPLGFASLEAQRARGLAEKKANLLAYLTK